MLPFFFFFFPQHREGKLTRVVLWTIIFLLPMPNTILYVSSLSSIRFHQSLHKSIPSPCLAFQFTIIGGSALQTLPIQYHIQASSLHFIIFGNIIHIQIYINSMHSLASTKCSRVLTPWWSVINIYSQQLASSEPPPPSASQNQTNS